MGLALARRGLQLLIGIPLWRGGCSGRKCVSGGGYLATEITIFIAVSQALMESGFWLGSYGAMRGKDPTQADKCSRYSF